MKVFLSTTAIACITAMSASAQEVTFSEASLAYDKASVESDEIADTTFMGAIEGTFDQFFLGAGVSVSNFDFIGPELTATSYHLSAGYFVVPGALIGGSLTGYNLSDGTNSEDFSGFDLFAQYETDQFGVAVNYARPNSDFEENNITQFMGMAQVAPGFEVAGIIEMYEGSDSSLYVVNGQYETGPIVGRGYVLGYTEEDGQIFGANGAYDFGSGVSAFAAVESASEGFFIDGYYAFAIGAGYEFMPGVSVEGSVGRIMSDESPEDIDTLSLEVRYEMGTRARLDKTITNQVIEDLENGYFGIFPDLGFGGLIGFGAG